MNVVYNLKFLGMPRWDDLAVVCCFIWVFFFFSLHEYQLASFRHAWLIIWILSTPLVVEDERLDWCWDKGRASAARDGPDLKDQSEPSNLCQVQQLQVIPAGDEARSDRGHWSIAPKVSALGIVILGSLRMEIFSFNRKTFVRHIYGKFRCRYIFLIYSG